MSGCDSRKHTSSFLGINANQGQVFPQLLQEVIQVQLHAATKVHEWTEKKKEKKSSSSSIDELLH